MSELPETVKPEDLGLSSARLEKVSGWMRGYVESGRLPCALTLVARGGKVVYLDHCGFADVEEDLPLAADTIFRIYSMTKPVVAVAAMMLYEDGHFQIDDPLAKFLPEFADMKVYVSGHGSAIKTVAADGPITIGHLLTHTAGLTYGFLDETPVGDLYRDGGIEFNPGRKTLGETVEALAALPLVCQPGSGWNYSVSFDVLGRLVEVVSGSTLDAFFNERIFTPLGMDETAFSIAADKADRFAALYRATDAGGFEKLETGQKSAYANPKLFSGGGGLVSTVADYYRFTEFLRRKGEFNGNRLLGRKTVEFMTANHLEGDLAGAGQPRFSETTFEGIGFGFGMSVMLDPARAAIMGSPGEFSWGGAASTAFWIDPVEDMSVIFMTQLLPSSTYPLRRELRVLTYQTLID